MKKALLWLTVASLVFLSGCTGYREINRGYIVSAVGFKKQGDEIKIVLETLSPRETAENANETEILSGCGNTFMSAFSNLKQTAVKEPYFNQCVTVIIDGSVSDGDITRMFDFCNNILSVSAGAYAVRSPDIDLLFDKDGITGYDIAGLIKQNFKDENSHRIYRLRRDISENKSVSLTQVTVFDEKYVLYANESENKE